MTQLFNRWLPALTFAAWGAVTLFLGSNSRYLAEPFTLYAKIAGVILLICAVVLAVTRPDVACCRGAACSHGLSRSTTGKLFTFAIIALPLALMPIGSAEALAAVQAKNRKEKVFTQVSQDAIQEWMRMRAAQKSVAGDPAVPSEASLPGKILPPPPLPLPEKGVPGQPGVMAANSQPPAPTPGQASPAPGATPAAEHPAAAPQESFAQYFDKSPDGNIIAEVLDLLYAAQDNVLLADFQGKKVEMIVQFMPDNGKHKPEGVLRFKGVRMYMQCCTADARPIATLVEVDKMPELPEMSWVKVTGIATFPVERGQRVSVLKAEKVVATEPPAETMLQ